MSAQTEQRGNGAEPDASQFNLPFGKDYGAVILNQAGLKSSARTTDDGRVNIDIEEGSKELSSLLLSALRRPSTRTQEPTHAFHAIQDAHAVALNIVVQVVGSRGDVQPFVALSKELQKYGHRIRLATHPVFKGFVEENGIEFFNLGGDPAELMAFMVKNPGLMPGNDALKDGEIGLRRKAMLEIMQRSWRSCFEKGTGDSNSRQSASDEVPFVADAIIANPPSFGHVHCAERLGIPLHIMFTMPWSPTTSFPHPLSNIQNSNAESDFTNWLTYTLVELLTWQGLGDLVNQFREITLGLPPLTVFSGPGILGRLKIPHTYCWSPALIPKPKDWSQQIAISGFYFLSHADSYKPADDLRRFLEAGPAPVYIGFGSIVVDDPNAMTNMILEAVKKSGQRALVSKGWGGLGSDELSVPDNVFMLGNVPHDWLFKHVSCVVHHGGAGTTAAGIAAGKPTVIVPFFGDQPFWGQMVARAGAGPDPVRYKDLTADKLAESIEFALKESTVKGAGEMAKSIAAENGAKAGVEHFHQELDMNSLRCSILPGLKATWKVKKSDTRLSPLAASLLIDEGKIRVDQLTILHTRSYDSSKAPYDPISGGAGALVGTIGNMMGGVTDIPTDIFRHMSRAFSNKSKNEGKEELKPMTLQSGIDAGKGVARVVTAGLKSPMDFTVALTKGFHNAPKLYGDKTVRDMPEVNDFSGGVKAATMGLGQGFVDGISGLLTQPAKGAREEGFAGLIKGFGKGIGGVIFKPAAGIYGVPGYLSQGVYQELRQRITLRSDADIVAGRIIEGKEALKHISAGERKEIAAAWQKQSVSKIPPKQAPIVGGTKDKEAQRADLIKQNVAAAVEDSSRGDAEEDRLVAQAVEASLADTLGGYDDTLSVASSTAPTHSRVSLSSTLVDDAPPPYDDAAVDSDEDANLRRAIERSKLEK